MNQGMHSEARNLATFSDAKFCIAAVPSRSYRRLVEWSKCTTERNALTMEIPGEFVFVRSKSVHPVVPQKSSGML